MNRVYLHYEFTVFVVADFIGVKRLCFQLVGNKNN